MNTADGIFKNLYMCRVPYLDSLEDDELEMYGILHVNDLEYDTATRTQLIDKYITINQMVELFKRGVNIYVVKHDDSKKIYDAILKHLLYWSNEIKNGLINRVAPVEDLIDLDRFASIVYPHARNYTTTALIESIIKKDASSNLLIPTEEIMRSRPNNNGRMTLNDSVDNAVVEKEHQSLKDIFENRRIRSFTPAYTTKTDI